MKKRWLLGLLLAAVLVCFCAFAQADTDPLKVEMELSSRSFSAKKTITVSIQVTNVGEGDMPSAVTLYYPNGKQVEEFGAPVLSVGASKSWSGSWTVTDAQLEAGKISFSIKYSVYDDNGELVNKTKRFSKTITYTGAVSSIEVNRTITPSIAQKGQEVTVTYEIANTGNIGITDVSIKENSSISSTKGTIDSIAAGEKASYTFKVTMGTKDLTSEATITYKANGKTQTATKEAATVRYGQVNLSASLAADKKGGAIGETATLTLTLKNSGKTDYKDVTVTDPTLGEVFTGETVPAGETVTLTREVTLESSMDYRFTVKAVDTDGMEVETATSTVTLKAVAAEDVVSLTVTAEADRDTVYEIPGTVRFTISVTNNGQKDILDVKVYAVDTLLYTFETITAGQTCSFVRDMDVSMAGTYAFDARCYDALGASTSFRSNTLYIGYAQPTAVPTEAPVYTPVAPKLEDLPTADDLPAYYDTLQQVLNVLKTVFAVLAIAGAALAVAGLIRRAMQKSANANANLLESEGVRDYNQPADEKTAAEYEAGIPAEQPEEAEAEDQNDATAAEDEENGDAMADALDRIYGTKPAEEQPDVRIEEDTDSAEQQAEQADAPVSHRRVRINKDDKE